MSRNDFIWLFIIVLIVAGGIWVVTNPDYPIRQGLDLQGGLQVLLQADPLPGQEVTNEDINTAASIIEQRINALGLTEPLVEVAQGENRIVVELPGVENPQEAISLIQETALLEFIDTGSQPLEDGTCVRTSYNNGQPSRCELDPENPDPSAIQFPASTYETILTGAGLRSAAVESSQYGEIYVSFSLQPDAAEVFANYTRDNIGNFLTIVLDKQVVSSPRINSAIDGGSGSITGNFTYDEASTLALQLRYGSLPVPLVIESTRQVGATLGEFSINSSIRAGAIGLAIVLLFMFVYYRLPGFLADIALLAYALLNVTAFMLFGVTLTLPAITGFLLSTGMAVDANILVFERMKEELRKGATLREAILTGFDKAWSSIRDSNIATLVICGILLIFGRSFGASVVVGFAITLAIGVMISMFTAVIITRTLVRIIMGRSVAWLKGKKWLLGV
ncbi:MAG: protein translocase subunit SecD [Ardenticatenaceae bacterium]|nr:protein translocase subunit SecD [Anaerolineales bacterium]MCB8920718.1 protein translocase subunit SecD [Ardenticatenaceae bacterium]MCB8989677.1 protein translocase subunit SecD [Ardenticatenaceae bacterium]MCB9002864.1 protein translocase subunit SecD [Ardenticatenaceae bacterium]